MVSIFDDDELAALFAEPKKAKSTKRKAKAKAKPRARAKAKAKAPPPPVDKEAEPRLASEPLANGNGGSGKSKKNAGVAREFRDAPAKRRGILSRSWQTPPNVLSRLHVQTGIEVVLFMRTEYGDTITYKSPNAHLDTLVSDIAACQASGNQFVLDKDHPDHSTVHVQNAPGGVRFSLPQRITSKTSLVDLPPSPADEDAAAVEASFYHPQPSSAAAATTTTLSRQLIHDAANVVASVSTHVSSVALAVSSSSSVSASASAAEPFPLDGLAVALELFLCESSLRIAF